LILDQIYQAIKIYWFLPKITLFYLVLTLFGMLASNNILLYAALIMDFFTLISGYT